MYFFKSLRVFSDVFDNSIFNSFPTGSPSSCVLGGVLVRIYPSPILYMAKGSVLYAICVIVDNLAQVIRSSPDLTWEGKPFIAFSGCFFIITEMEQIGGCEHAATSK